MTREYNTGLKLRKKCNKGLTPVELNPIQYDHATDYGSTAV